MSLDTAAYALLFVQAVQYGYSWYVAHILYKHSQAISPSLLMQSFARLLEPCSMRLFETGKKMVKRIPLGSIMHVVLHLPEIGHQFINRLRSNTFYPVVIAKDICTIIRQCIGNSRFTGQPHITFFRFVCFHGGKDSNNFQYDKEKGKEICTKSPPECMIFYSALSKINIIFGLHEMIRAQIC